MKKAYAAPQLTVHGNVEDVTNAFGASGANDTIQFNGNTFPGSIIGASGSQNGTINPQ
ncbi:hypothetical protein Nos7524_0687 [Nostoc sp. PCC 7524]|jgi:hypothetical protein|uniref:lasso peptide n=1 Tax=Nostoc sp. (strain ATCC 29411 / PCC 7524) TaxID=28072 RepID=UPI00029F43FE|nr:lasso peptide [Nostoc sp. PCC 7524]AFY46593.1 hypothetical protein Nos7524_0687 [Nostoc sp. PCC 7524]